MSATPADARILSGTELLVWQHVTRTLLPDNAAYLWSQVYDLAVRKVGHVAHRGDAWQRNVTSLAEAVLTELGVPWEIHAGRRYVAGKRISWDSNRGRWRQDDYRPE